MEAQTLWDLPKGSTKSAYEKWDKRNPEVYARFREWTLKLIAAGKTEYSALTILGAMRAIADIESIGTPYQINNSMAPYYARKFMAEFPKHRDFFETRRSKLDI